MKLFLKLLLTMAVGFSLALPAAAQQSDKAKRSELILKKARQLDLLNHILPLTLTKAQINSLLAPIERCRRKVKEIEDLEAADLAKFESKIDSVVAEGADQGKVPGKTFLVELSKLLGAFSVRRQIAAGENAEMMLAEIKKSWNKGQISVAANSLDIKAYEPSVDPATLTEDYKLSFFIKDVLLDPQSYDLLVRIAKRAS